ncbi:MAG: methyltransferase domain-containing protein [Bacteroidales bacterium]|nr:methyltransferase domain-containing protein [Bacteroidales bacterium]
MLADTLRHIDYAALPISDYSRRYILRMLPDLDYYLDIYRRSLDRLLAGRTPQEATLVDYGGGHGFFSLAAKERGVHRVIYVDYNPQAEATVRAVAARVGFGPDDILQGDAHTLRQWCEGRGVCPDFVAGMDVIEHIYRLEDFFADLYALNPQMRMLFTTGSTPYNPHVRHRLHRVMRADELGRPGEEGFRALRRRYIAQHCPQLDAAALDGWAAHTRGLTYDDALAAVRSGKPYEVGDRYNTCDPATGSWTERILPIAAYRRLLEPYGARLEVSSGYYNTFRSGGKALPSRRLNGLIATGGFRWLAPFIILSVTPDA